MRREIDAVTYELTWKKVKNINLRVGEDGTVKLSAPRRVPVAELDRFVASRAEWITQAQARMTARAACEAEARTDFTDAECLAAFTAVSDRIYPLFAQILPEKPTLRVRLMKSRWGVCHVSKRTITLNKQLFAQALPAIEYVVLHEYVHFLYPDHQKGFHAAMARLMPDYKARRALLRTSIE